MLIDFVVREARLLDEKRYEEWHALFTDDAIYWVPLAPGQPDGLDAQLAPLRRQAAARAAHRAAEEPARLLAAAADAAALHLLQTPTVERGSDAGAAATCCAPCSITPKSQGDEIDTSSSAPAATTSPSRRRLRMT